MLTAVAPVGPTLVSTDVRGMLSHSGLNKLSRRTAGGLRDNQRQSGACFRLLKTLAQNVSLHRHPWSYAAMGTAPAGEMQSEASRTRRWGVYWSVEPVTVRLIDRQRRRRTMAAERDSMTLKAVLLDVFGMLLDDEADIRCCGARPWRFCFTLRCPGWRASKLERLKQVLDGDVAMTPQTCRLLAFLVVLSFHASVNAENWPGWRGPRGDGTCIEKGLPTTWNTTENVVWKVKLPERGNSTPIVWGDRVFVTQAIEKEGRRTLMCFDRNDGKLLWQKGTEWKDKEPTHGTNPLCVVSRDRRRTSHRVVRFGRAVLLRLRRQRTLETRPRHTEAHLGLRSFTRLARRLCVTCTSAPATERF